MIELKTRARLNASNFDWVKTSFEFDPDEPFVIILTIHSKREDVEWEIGRQELRDAVMTDWPSGTHDIIMIKFEDKLRVYLSGQEDKFTLDFKIKHLKSFLAETYEAVSHWQEQAHIEEEIDKWTSS